MITHKAFTEHLNRLFTKAQLERGSALFLAARNTLAYAIQEIDIHTRNSVTKPPQLLRLERDIFREAYLLELKTEKIYRGAS